MDCLADIEIKPLEGRDRAGACARMMSSSEPWLTLGRDYHSSLAMFTDPGREVLVADKGGEVAGFVVLIMDGPFIGYVQSLGVDPGCRGRGLGAALMARAEERIFAATPNVFICVSSFNPGARRLYQRLGYEEIGELKDWIVAGHSEILMRKTIGPLNGFHLDR